ncbi:MAG: hypothetical protein IT326_03810 [Anaerolineae bacterium]|nr:hypothetical protein [Anaerolineae bacterium]
MIAAVACTAIILRAIPGLRIIDDAYITYRYAWNILRGLGFVYNLGEPVLGTTTPLYTLMLAAVGWPGAGLTGQAALPEVSVTLNTLADGLGAALLFLIAYRLSGERVLALACGLLWAFSPQSITFAIGGMETSVAIALMLGAFYAWLVDRPVLAALIAGLATLTRPDSLIWAGLLAPGMIVTRWRATAGRPFLSRLPLAEAGSYLLIVTPWVVCATLFFGSPLPHSIAAKSVAYHLEPTQGLVAMLQNFSAPFFEDVAFGPTGVIAGALVYPILAALGGLTLFHRDRRSLPLVLYPWLYALAFTIANPLIFRWYNTPPLPFYFLCIVAGLWGITTRLFNERWAWFAVALSGLLWLGLNLNAWELHPDHGPDRPAPEMAWFKLELLYAQAGQELAPLVTADTTIAAGDIGALGWTSGARILDTLGLVSPQSVAYSPVNPAFLGETAPYAVAPDLIVTEQPDFIVILEVYGRNGLLRDPRFAQLYRLRERIETDIYGSDGMLIYERARD